MEYIPPKHYTLTNIGLLLKKYPITKLLLTEKIDGIYKYDKIYSDINDDIFWNGEICQYELLGNKKFVFNSSNNIILEPNNYEEFIKMIESFRKSTEGKNIINKPYYRLNLDIIKYIDEIINIDNDIYPIDGWILTSDDLKFILKLKPIKHMTLDLYYNNKTKKWLTRENIIIDIPEYNISSGIWRLYWEKSKWIPKDKRFDKNKPNEYKIVKYIIDFINKPFSLYQLINTILSKELYYQIHNKIKNKDTINYIKSNNIFLQNIIKAFCNDNMNVLDIGCGKGKYISNTTNWFGVDIDLGALDIPERKNNFTGIWLDFTKKWDPMIQEKELGNIWRFFKNKLLKLKYTSFDLILWFYSLHFCKNFDELQNVFNEINSITKKNSIILLNLIDKNFDQITFSNGYIKRHDNIIKRFYKWCNVNETIEYIWSLDDILNAGKVWSVETIIDFNQYFDEDLNIDTLGWNEWNKNNHILVLIKNI
jgi:ubiquinone/menaquinone biosynthesis C-methylase UbiE